MLEEEVASEAGEGAEDSEEGDFKNSFGGSRLLCYKALQLIISVALVGWLYTMYLRHTSFER